MRVHIEVGVASDWFPWRPGEAGSMQGGTERLAHRLGVEFARAGLSVTARGGGAEGLFDGVSYGRGGRSDVDLLVCVMAEAPVDIRAARVIAWSHAAQWPRTADWDCIVAVSDYHADLLRSRLPGATVVPIPAGCTLVARGPGPRDRFLYAFSPDRGLHRLLEIWPALWREFKTPLAVAYDARAVIRRHGARPDAVGERVRILPAALNQPGVIVHGPLTDQQMVELRGRSRAVLYPLDPVLAHSELYSLSLLESCAAGVPLVLSRRDALPLEYADAALFADDFAPDSWIRACQEVLSDERHAERALQHARRRPHAEWVRTWLSLAGEPPTRRQVTARMAQRWVVVSAGIGHGEAALAREVIDAARDRGHEVTVITNDASHLVVLPDAQVIQSGKDVFERLVGFDRIVLSSSMTCGILLHHLRAESSSTPIVGLDFSWPEWLLGALPDLVICTLGPEAFDAGLAGEIPAFSVPEAVRQRTRCVGPLPPPVVIRKAPAILLYLGVEPGWARELLTPLGVALRAVAAERGLRVRMVGGDSEVGALVGVEHVASLSRSDFREAVGEAQLVIAHPGAGTLGLARSLGTRMICVTEGRALSVEPSCLGEREAQAWYEAGWVEHLPGVLPAHRYRELIEGVLDAAPPPLAGGGAARAVAWIEACSTTPRTQAPWRPIELSP